MSWPVPFGRLRAQSRAQGTRTQLARFTPEGRALGFNRAMRMDVLLSVIDMVLALAALLGCQSLSELALGLVLGCLFMAGFAGLVATAHAPNSYR
jgi:hypothetical protein